MIRAGCRRWMPCAPLLLVAAVLVALAWACGGDDSSPGGGSSSPASATWVTVAPSGAQSGTNSDLTGVPGSLIVFNTNRDGNFEIYSMKTDGSGTRDLTNHPTYDVDPDVSPDGRTIAFASIRDAPNPQIMLMDIDGANVRKLTEAGWGDQAPKWSRDGQQLAFARAGSVWVMNADGSGQRVLMQASGAGSDEECRNGSFPGGWSVDDRRIVYYSTYPTASGQVLGQICTVDVESSDVQVLVSGPEGALNAEPSWSPDGKRVAYRGIIDGNPDVWWVDVDSGERFNVTDSPSIDLEPSWSPDGQWITFGSNRDDPSNFEIYFVRADGTDVRRFTHEPNKDSESIWVP